MADNWWDSVSASASSSAARSCMDSVSSVSGNSSSINNLFLDSTHKLLPADHDHSSTTTTTTADGSSGTGILASDPSLQMMGLGLSSQVSLDWNQTLFRGDHQNRETNFRPMIQEDHLSSSTSTNFQQESGMSISSQDQWRSQKVYKYCGNSEDSSINHRGFSLDHQPVHVQQQQYGDHSSSSVITCQGLPCSFQMDMNSYGTPASNMFQSLLSSENQLQPQPQPQQQPNYNSYNPSGYGSMNSSAGDQLSSSSWSKFPQFLRNSSPPKVQQQPANNQLHFSNNAPFWNATAAPMNDSRSNFFPSLQMQLPPSSNFDDKPLKQTSSEGAKKSSSESSNKRPRNDNPPSLPAFKVRKEKMGDRITALQQLVSPFGKTDTASVLSEAIEYIKFLHEQVSVLSTPYMKNGAPVVQHHQMLDKSSEGPKPDLRSRGLCLVPVSSTFPVTHETPVDFWTPSFGGTFR